MEYEKRYLHKSGRIVWVRIRLSRMTGSSEGWHFVTHLEDITERRRVEEAIRASEERVRLLMDSTAEAICGVDLQGICTFANPACLRMLGYSGSQAVVGKNMHDLTHHTRADGLGIRLPNARSSGRSAAKKVLTWTTRFCGAPTNEFSGGVLVASGD